MTTVTTKLFHKFIIYNILEEREREMSNAIKYNFDNVLVADTKLLVQAGKTRGSPQVLVLNNRLNKCEHRRQPIRCDTCCLQIEEAQFKRRSDIFQNTTDCFAKCSERRLVGIELNAKARLSGKLVILGLTRNFNLRRESSSPTKPIKCQTDFMLSYSRFEPSNHALTGSQSTNLTYYTKFDHNQLPSISIDGAGLHWDSSKQKEIVSFSLESNRHGDQDDISLKETLVVIEMSCFHPSTIGLNTTELKFLRKIHLLALLNRDIVPRKNIIKPIIESNSGRTIDAILFSGEQSKSLPPTTTTTTTGFNQIEQIKVDTSQIKRATQNYVNKTTLNEYNPNFRIPEIDNRIDSSSESVKDLMARHRHTTDTVGNNSLPARFAPGLVNLKDLDLISMRLKSNSFLILTVSCSFVILTYTLCLLIYLKSRKSRVKNLEKTTSKSRTIQQQSAANISHPYNLQMPPDTQNRLENLLNARSEAATANSNRPHFNQEQELERRQHQQTNHYTELDDQHKLVKSRRKNASSKRYQCAQFGSNYNDCQCEHGCYFDESYIQTPDQPNFANYGTLTIMRAIRQAASLARYRLRNSRYQPNLKVIPESDHEHAQTLSRGNLEQCEQLLRGSNKLSPSIKAEQIETLLYNAMKSKCSHIAERAQKQKRKRKHNNQQTNATLFAKPIDSAESNETPEIEVDPISRSRIIRHLQSEDAGSDARTNLDTRI